MLFAWRSKTGPNDGKPSFNCRNSEIDVQYARISC
jgi:hypothetical protein